MNCYFQDLIITGCTMSAILFSLTMNMLVKATEVECRGPLFRSGVRQSPIRAYMDDLTVTTTSVMGGRWLLKSLKRNISTLFSEDGILLPGYLDWSTNFRGLLHKLNRPTSYLKHINFLLFILTQRSMSSSPVPCEKN